MRAEGSDGELSFNSLVMTQDEFNWPYGHSNDDAEHVMNPNQEPVVTIRVGARVNGQCVEVQRTFFFKSVRQEIIDAYSAVLDTELAVLDAIAAGVSVETLDLLVQTGLSSYIGQPDISYSYYWGHGIGEFALVEPFLSNETVPTTLVENQLLAIQIWLYHNDGWYVRIEDTVQVTSTGINVLSDAPKTLEDVFVLPSSPRVDDDTHMIDYEYGSETTANITISDTANRSISSIDYYDGNSWKPMEKLSSTNFSISYNLDYNYASFIRSILRIELSNDTVYLINELTCDPGMDFVYNEIYEPPVHAVVEQVTRDDPYRWIFSKVGAEMLRINFYNIYPPPGDQFLVRDAQGNVVFEYKWNLGATVISPWVPGNVLYIDVISTWSSEFGGFNHFYFTVDMLWILDTEYTPPESEPTTSTSISPTTSSSTITTTIIDTNILDLSTIFIGVLASSGIVLIVLFFKRSRSSHRL